MPPALFRTSQSAPPGSLRAPPYCREDESNQDKPQARQIASVRGQERDAGADADASGEFVVHEATLRHILLRKDVLNMKVAVISVTGPSRTGKSFLLSLLLQHLNRPRSSRPLRAEDLDAGASSDWEEKWDSSGAGLTSTDSALANKGENGFAWRSGSDHHTTGVWMWDTPFICKSNKGEDIAVFLVDTQGLFDSETSDCIMQSIFGFTTLLSSTQIYNVSRTVGEDTLHHLGRLVGCSSLVAETASAPTTPSSSSSSEESSGDFTPFQRVCVLVRDWQSFSRAQTTQEKRAAMSTYGDNVLAPQKDPTMTQTREQLAACFDAVDFFMLPPPGSEVTDPEYDGSLSSIDSKFMELATMLFDELVDPINLAPKTIRGTSLTCAELFTYAKTCAALFQDASRLPDLATAFAASTKTVNTEALKAKALRKYEEEMDEFCEPGITWIRSKKFKAQHEESKRRALLIFTDEAGVVGKHTQTAQEELVVEIDAKSPQFKKRIKRRNFKSFTKVSTMVSGAAMAIKTVAELFQ